MGTVVGGTYFSVSCSGTPFLPFVLTRTWKSECQVWAGLGPQAWGPPHLHVG